jgi:hypothetical protein
MKGSNMTESKKWYMSKTIWSALVTVVIGTLMMIGVGTDVEAEQENIVELIMQVVGLVAGALAVYGRVTAKSEVTK